MSGAEKRAALSAGTLIGERYRIVSPLARGGFGVVYVAEQLSTERRVALKLLPLHLADVSVDRLLAEARIASRVSSEHIVQVFDAGVDPDSSLVFVAMELLAGTDLAELVRSQGPRSAEETVEYVRQVAVGLDKVHGFVGHDGHPAPIIHRDLKPGNLFLTRREDGSAWIKILDFGAAKVLSSDSHVSGVLRGTPQYMAYEQASGGAITPQTDIWALGLIAFYLLSGRSYWLGAGSESGQAQIFAEVLTLPLVPPSERLRELGLPLELGAAFDSWFARCVNREPAKRFSTAGEAARELSLSLDVALSGRQAPWSGPASGRRERVGPETLTPDLAAVARSSRWRRAPRSRLTASLVALAALGASGALFWAVRSGPDQPVVRTPDAGSSVTTSAAQPIRTPSPSSLAPAPALPQAEPAGPANPRSTPATSAKPPQLGASPRRKVEIAPRASASAPSSNEELYDLR